MWELDLVRDQVVFVLKLYLKAMSALFVSAEFQVSTCLKLDQDALFLERSSLLAVPADGAVAQTNARRLFIRKPSAHGCIYAVVPCKRVEAKDAHHAPHLRRRAGRSKRNTLRGRWREELLKRTGNPRLRRVEGQMR
jgi:hypothetical protein